MSHEAGAAYGCIKCHLDPPGRPACPIVRMCDEKGGIWVPALQTFNVCTGFLNSDMSLAAFERLCAGSGNARVVHGPDLRQLIAAGAAQPHASHVSIMKLHALLKKLQYRLTPRGKAIHTQLTALKKLTSLKPWDDTADLWKVPMPLPTALPERSGAPPRRYAIMALSKVAPQLLTAAPLQGQLTDLKLWYTNHIQLDRDGHAIGHRSFYNISDLVNRYLGFMHAHCKVQLPTLLHFLQPRHHAAYLKNMLEKGASHYAPRAHAYASNKVICFLQSQPRGAHGSLDQLKVWLRRAAAQIKASLPVTRKDIDLMKASGTWADAAELLAIILKGKALAEELASHQRVLFDDARDIHDATLACCIFGFIPPPRLSCLRECTVPSYNGPCLHPDCKQPSECRGNQLRSPEPGDTRLKFYFAHHKTANSRQRARPIHFRLPQDLSDLLQLYLRHGRPVLVKHSTAAAGHPFLFLSKNGSSLAGKAGASKLTGMFQGWMARLGGKSISPGLCRHIFVVDRRSHAHLPGPVDQHAAIAMGHSAKQWELGIYDIGRHPREAQQAVDSMAAWRLSHQQGQQGTAAVAQPDAAEPNNEGDVDGAEDDLYLSFSDDDLA